VFLITCGVLLLNACGNGGDSGSSNTPTPPGSAAPPAGSGIQAVQHIVILMQENRSFDDYFGQMTAYRQRNNIPTVGSPPTINDLSTGSFSNISPANHQPIASYHSGSVCTEDLTPDWTETHKMMNLQDPVSAGAGAPMNGFVSIAYGISQFGLSLGIPMADTTGRRAMGYFDDSDLNYYYFMASNFAISDALFAPVPSRTPANRFYIHAATSQGIVHGVNEAIQLNAKTIWEELDAAHVSWKIYIADTPAFTYLSEFTYFKQPGVAAKAVPLSQYFADLKANTLPSVAFIETGQFSGRDEHTSNFDPANPAQGEKPINVQAGASFAESIINPLMQSSSWSSSVFFLTFDEGGGLFDHVPPISVPSPDGIKPSDLKPNDVPGDFTITGNRVPNIVISPFTKKNFVSHTPMDYTAYLKFIETRFNLPALTARDAAMPDMTEFFDFTGKPWATPPAPPAQNTNGTCDFAKE
jgi:phospholipase C